jgi:predicted DCC family thiol-disulfide oxidoreductase YuxK
MKTTMYFDGGCPVCARGVAHWRRLDWARRIDWVDLMDHPDALSADGVDFASAMESLHVRGRDGRLVVGGDAFLALWDELPGWRWVSRLVRGLGLNAAFDRAYRWHSRGRFEKRCVSGTCPVPAREIQR